MILHSDNSVTLTEEEWLKARPRWISMADANPDDGEVVLCCLLSKHGHKEYGNWDDESSDDYFCDREAVYFWLWEPSLPPLPPLPTSPTSREEV